MGRIEIDRAVWQANAGRAPFAIRHTLVDDERLSHEAVTALAHRLPETSIESNVADRPLLVERNEVPPLDRSPGELARDIEALRRWMALKQIEQVPEYATLLHECLDEVAAALALNGSMTAREGYIFLSAARSVVPAHIDHEHNLLLQVLGTKRVTIGTFPDRDTEQRALEELHTRNGWSTPILPHEPQTFLLEPGTGVYIPPRGVHMVENDGSLSLSLSLVFHTPSLDRAARVYTMNAKLRRLGLDPRPPEQSDVVDRAKSGAVRAWQRVRATLP